MNKSLFVFLLITSTSFLASCDEKQDSETSVIERRPVARLIEVNTMSLAKVPFEHELISNGKVTASNIAELKFHTSEIISKIFVRNGARVKKGESIASLDTYALKQSVAQAKDILDRTKLEFQDVLIGQGYKISQIASIPNETQQLAKVKSGYNSAQTQWEIAERNLHQATIVSPIAGIIANLYVKPYTQSSPSTVFCNIIDPTSLEIVFSILESEVALIHDNDRVTITPYALPDRKIEGHISEINPWVDEKGMVRVKARVNYNSSLIEGMNVRVHIFRSVGKQWVIPKTAVVSRTGKQVVFTFLKGRSNWNYVQTGLENANQYTITSSTLKNGDQIIVSGNADLSHGTPVKVVEATQ